MALIYPDQVKDDSIRRQIEALTYGYRSGTDCFIEKLAEEIGTIAIVFYPKPVVVSTSDFKSNEYTNLIGGQDFELPESNPMIGFCGASRYILPRYREAFSLECQALKKVMEGMALINVIPMIPLCRTVEEGMSWWRWAAASLSETRTASRSTSCVRSPTT
jgi:pyruvate,water dikinase